MKRIIIDIATINDAFQDGNFPFEVAGILKSLAKQIEEGQQPNFMRDSNGNPVCRIAYSK